VNAIRLPMARFAANSVPLAASQLASNALLLVSLVLVARVLGPQDYGLFAIAFAMFALAGFISDAGLGLWGIRVIDDDPDRWSTVIRLGTARAVTVGATLFLGFAIVSALPLPLGSAGPALVMLATVVPVAFSLEYALLGLERTRFVALVRVATSLVILGLSPVLALLLGPVGAAIGYLAAAGVGCVMSWILFVAVVGPPRLRRPDRVIETLRNSFPMAVNSVVGQVYKQSDSVLTGIILSASAAGIYAAPVRILSAVSSFGWVIGSALLPIYRSLDAEGGDRLSALATNAIRLLILATVPAIGVGIGGANAIVAALFGPAFADSATILSIGAVGAGISLCLSPAGYAILARRHDRRYVAATVASAIVAVPLVVILALLTRDPWGVAVAMLLAEVASAVVLVVGSRRSGLAVGNIRWALALGVLVGLAGLAIARSVPGGIAGVLVVGVLAEIPFGLAVARELLRERQHAASSASNSPS
jgi:O-antigen/teichoic acid export membrane protein